jgi:putative membrane protein
MTEPKPIAPNDFLAAERTFLAWIRTGLALIGLGFVVARFGLFLQTLSIHLADSTYRAYGQSLWFGTGLIILGVIVIVGSMWNFFRLIERLKQGNGAFDRPPRLAIAVTIALAAAGLAMAIYLISVH